MQLPLKPHTFFVIHGGQTLYFFFFTQPHSYFMKFKEQVKEGREKAKKERRRTAQDKQNNNVDGENAVL